MADIFNMLDTWNAAGTVFTGIKLNVTDTASAAGSLLMDLQVGGVSRFRVDKLGSFGYADALFDLAGTGATATIRAYAGTGAQFAATLSAAGIVTGSGMRFGWSSGNNNLANPSPDLALFRDAANTLAQRNGVNAQAFNLYQSYTDASNYTRGRVAAASGIVTLAGESAGTGAADIDIAITPKGTGRVRYGTHAAIAAETVTGYIEIKDAGGTVRKIAVVS